MYVCLHHALIADEFTSKFFLVKSYSITADPHALMLQEYNYISKKRLAHITGSSPNPGHFSVLVRSIPKSDNELLDDTIRNFFVNYHGSSYLSHQMIYRKENCRDLW
jgi:calcium permeable stress-gated cation channel